MRFEDIDYSKYNFQKMSDEEFQSVPPEIKRSCYDCAFCKPALSWWCTNKEAIKLRGTSIPGIIKCPYWEKK